MFHPEYEKDFQNIGIYQAQPENLFSDHPLDGIQLDRQLGLLDMTGPNCLEMDGPGSVSNLTDSCKMELSVHRCYPAAQGPNNDTTAGKYHLSIILLTPDDISPDGSEPILQVRLTSRSTADTTQIATLVFDVPGSAFRDAANTPIRDQVIEYHLGLVELRLDQGAAPENLIFNIVDCSNRPLGLPLTSQDTASTNAPGLPWAEIAGGLYDSFDVEIEYLSGTAGRIRVDAVCFSTPTAYALFRPDDTHLQADYAHVNENFEGRLRDILFDMTTTPPTPHSRVRMLYGAEQDWSSGAWRSSKYVSRRLDQWTDGNVRLYTPTSAWTDQGHITHNLDMYRGGVSGYYHYPIHWDVPTPQEPITEYYSRLYLADDQNLQFTTHRYKTYAAARKQYGSFTPWIPFIQNHSNIYEDDAESYDGDPLREPTAAEVRVQANLALAYGADGIMLWQFSQAPVLTSDIPYWPLTKAQWDANPTRRDANMGGIGLLNADNLPRTVDMNGENKWDSTRMTLTKIKFLGQYMKDSSLAWDCGKSWYGAHLGDADNITTVISQRLNAPFPLDSPDSTIVETTEFTSGDGIRYIFAVNGRTDSLGHRDITVKLKQQQTDPDAHWLVTNVATGDIWVVRPSDAPDDYSTANGFTDYFPPGSAALYRLTLAATPREYLPGTLPGNLYVTPDATLQLTSANSHLVGYGKGVFVEGYLNASGSTFGPSNELWLGIHARNDGNVYLQNCQINGSSVVAGSGGNATVVDTRIEDAPYAFCNLGGTLNSARTTAPTCLYGYAWLEGSYSEFDEDKAAASYGAPSWNIGIDLHGTGFALLRKSTLNNFGRGILARAGTVTTNFRNLGRNTINAVSQALVTDSLGYIDFGQSTTDNGSQNCFSIQDYTNGYHAWGDGSKGIDAVGSHWEPMPLKLQGTVHADTTLPNCPAPFVDNSGSRSLTKTVTSPSATSFRNGLARAVCDSNFVLARQLISQRVNGTNRSTLDLGIVYTLRRAVLLFPELSEMRDTLVLAFLLHPDMRFKLVAADLLADDSRFEDALAVLEAYSFEGAAYLKKEQLVRSALYRPLAYQGGYMDGLCALDTLASIVGSDSTWLPIFELYPRLYSGVRPAIQDTSVRKSAAPQSLWDRILPNSIEVSTNYPNPFADVTSFTFKLGEATHVRLAVFDAIGREVAIVTDADYERGVHSAVLHSGTLPNGLYFYRLITDAGVVQRKMMLMR